MENPDAWLGRAVALAGDNPTMTEQAETFGRVIGRPVSYFQVPWDDFLAQAGEEFHKMFKWFNENEYEADIPALRKECPDLKNAETYLRRHGWEGAEAPTGGS